MGRRGRAPCPHRTGASGAASQRRRRRRPSVGVSLSEATDTDQRSWPLSTTPPQVGRTTSPSAHKSRPADTGAYPKAQGGPRRDVRLDDVLNIEEVKGSDVSFVLKDRKARPWPVGTRMSLSEEGGSVSTPLTRNKSKRQTGLLSGLSLGSAAALLSEQHQKTDPEVSGGCRMVRQIQTVSDQNTNYLSFERETGRNMPPSEV